MKNKGELKTTEFEFMKLWQSVMDWHKAVWGVELSDIRWCEKLQKTVKFADLPKMKCWECNRFLPHNGACDPL